MLTIALPLTLAWILFCVGLGLSPADFSRVLRNPKWVIIGLLSQFIILPATAWLMIQTFNIPTVIATGLILLALSPGGNTSNAITALARGDVALSTSLTAISSLLIPFSYPILFSLLTDSASLVLSPLQTSSQLLLITVLPLLVGMSVRQLSQSDRVSTAHCLLNRFIKFAPKTNLIALAVIVFITVVSNQQVLPHLVSTASFYVLLLCLLAMSFGLMIAIFFNASRVLQRTLAIEVGIQNAGTAIFVAIVQLQQPALAVTPLLYGILMNIPALLIIIGSRTSVTAPAKGLLPIKIKRHE